MPATFKRLADNVTTQMAAKSWEGVGLRRFPRRAAAVAGEDSAHPQFAVAGTVCEAGEFGRLAAGAGGVKGLS